MKKSIYILAISSLVAGTLITSCKSNTDKKEDAVEKVQKASDNLVAVENEANKDAMKKANDAEWQTYKAEANKTIVANETRIAELKVALKKPGKTFDVTYSKNIDALETKNVALKTKIINYENNQTDWSSFKREFDSDMTKLGKAFKDLTVNNKK